MLHKDICGDLEARKRHRLVSFYDVCIHNYLQTRYWPLLATGMLIKMGKDKDDQDVIKEFCSATMLSDRKTIITAAHCFLGFKVDYDEDADDHQKYTLKINLQTDGDINQIRFCPMYSRKYNQRKWSTVRSSQRISDFQWCEVVQY